ncbi:MAG: DUF1588 domain-containing protein [Gammaproteobacteria bacterium]|nr:DUF1588 domain-containing protein [Gammaproteobacteria bacterium]
MARVRGRKRVHACALAICLELAAGAFAQERGERPWERQLAAQQARDAARAEAMRERLRRERLALSRLRAHAGMPDTMYASTPTPTHADVSCPALADPDARLAYEAWVRGRRDPLRDVARGREAQSTVRVLSRGGAGRDARAAAAGTGPLGRHALSGAFAASADGVRRIPYFPSASDAHGRQGFARIVNRSPRSGTVEIVAVDDAGTRSSPLTLSIGAGRTVHFNSDDLERGNAGKGLSGSAGAGQGGWRLELSSALDVEALSYVRTADGFLTAMHDAVPVADGAHRVAVFNPGSNRSQESLLRIVNRGAETATARIEGTDDRGAGSGEATVEVAAGASRTYTASELETGAAPGLSGSLGDGAGKWRLAVESDAPLAVMSLLSSPTGHLTNLSTAPDDEADGAHAVPLFPSASDAHGRQGFVRVVNRSDRAGEVSVAAHDDTDRSYPAVTLSIGANETRHFNSDDLEAGNAGKGLSGSTGAGEGDWRLELASGLDIEVLSYIRTADGFLTAMHDVAPRQGTRHRVAVFNPGSNANQRSLLRIVNAGGEAAQVAISGTDDAGASPGSGVAVAVPAGSSRTLAAQELETGGAGFEGSLGDGAGKWSLAVESDAPVAVMSLLSSPTGHLTNLSTAPGGGAETAEEVFRTLISPIVQSKCVNCHVEGGASGNTRLVFATDDDADHLARNLGAFESLLAEVEDGADYVLNKIQGAAHGGGIQVASGTDEYAAMERFLGLLGGEVDEGSAVTVANLFDGVEMEPWRSTLRRAAIALAGRIPTEAEYESIRTGGWTSLRAAIRGLMTGSEFHEFLIRASNDRLLTDRDHSVIDATASDDFVDFANLYYAKVRDHYESGGPDHWQWYSRAQYGVRRAPLELIAHVVENDLPYTEILTADYIMANPVASAAYGASTVFRNADDDHEFRPSEIASYYRDGPTKDSEFFTATQLGSQAMLVRDPGDLLTDYPHAGILNTTVFLLRYPTTATNRNRARSRWTYYHFLGLDVEKSASRTTDPVALADTNNPTMHNPACTVCHSVLDPVAGAFQNYGDVGFYRDQWGGLDSLDDLYKSGQGDEVAVEGDSWVDRRTLSWPITFVAGPTTVRVIYTNDFYDDATEEEGRVYLDRLAVVDSAGKPVLELQFEDLEPPYNEPGGHYCGGIGYNAETGEHDHIDLWNGGPDCAYYLDLEVPHDGAYDVEIVAWAERFDQFGPDRMARIAVEKNPYRAGDTWYRDMREPGFNGELVAEADRSLPWLAGRIVADERFAEATVRFWWPAVMGTDVAGPPAEGDPDFEGRLLASNAQSAEVALLGRKFRRGFRGGAPYNLKDLLGEIVLSRWFRARTLEDDDPIRAVALRDAGARRLLTPEELASKTLAVTGFQWGRRRGFSDPDSRGRSDLTDIDYGYGLLYGGIDSDGITRRGRDLTSVMGGVAKRHAAVTACPVVMKDFYLLAEEDRRLFRGIDLRTTPISEVGLGQAIRASSRSTAETVSVPLALTGGEATVTLAFTNDHGDDGGDRNLRLDRLVVRAESGRVVETRELETLPAVDECNHPVEDHFALHCGGSVEVALTIPADGRYEVDVVVWADQYGDELPWLEVSVGTDTRRSAGGRAIRAKLAELHERLLGVGVGTSSPDVQAAYDLYIDIWSRRASDDGGHFVGVRCDHEADPHYFDDIADGLWREELDQYGNALGWDWERMGEFFQETDMPDPHHVARTWVVVLMYLLTDPRYLHL